MTEQFWWRCAPVSVRGPCVMTGRERESSGTAITQQHTHNNKTFICFIRAQNYSEALQSFTQCLFQYVGILGPTRSGVDSRVNTYIRPEGLQTLNVVV